MMENMGQGVNRAEPLTGMKPELFSKLVPAVAVSVWVRLLLRRTVRMGKDTSKLKARTQWLQHLVAQRW